MTHLFYLKYRIFFHIIGLCYYFYKFRLFGMLIAKALIFLQEKTLNWKKGEKMKSTSLVAALLMGALILSAGTAMANPAYHTRSSVEITESQEAELTKLSNAYQKEISPLREDLHAKEMEFYAISNLPEADMDRIRVLSKEIAALNTELREKRTAFSESAYKETGLSMYDRGYCNMTRGGGYHDGGRGGRGGHMNSGHGGQYMHRGM